MLTYQRNAGTMVERFLKRQLIRSLWFCLGRKNLVRLGRFLTNESRLDVPNDSETNGERMVIERVLTEIAPQKATVFDVGANVGGWARTTIAKAQELGTEVCVHTFEPCRDTFDALTRNLRQDVASGRALLNNIAMSSTVGTRRFYSFGANVGINSFYPTNGVQYQRIEDVETQTIDAYCSKGGVPRLHFVKVDTEGHDIEVLHGARGMIEAKRVDVIQFEYNFRWISSRRYLKDAFDYLVPLGYSIGKVTPLGIEFYSEWSPELETFREANFLAVGEALKDAFPRIEWWND